jgi:hypothetical protein
MPNSFDEDVNVLTKDLSVLQSNLSSFHYYHELQFA